MLRRQGCSCELTVSLSARKVVVFTFSPCGAPVSCGFVRFALEAMAGTRIIARSVASAGGFYSGTNRACNLPRRNQKTGRSRLHASYYFPRLRFQFAMRIGGIPLAGGRPSQGSSWFPDLHSRALLKTQSECHMCFLLRLLAANRSQIDLLALSFAKRITAYIH